MIDIQTLLIVAAASIVGAAMIVASYSVGLRLLVSRRVARPRSGARLSAPRSVTGRSVAAAVGAYTCFTLCGATVLLAIYLIVPALHR